AEHAEDQREPAGDEPVDASEQKAADEGLEQEACHQARRGLRLPSEPPLKTGCAGEAGARNGTPIARRSPRGALGSPTDARLRLEARELGGGRRPFDAGDYAFHFGTGKTGLASA